MYGRDYLFSKNENNFKYLIWFVTPKINTIDELTNCVDKFIDLLEHHLQILFKNDLEVIKEQYDNLILINDIDLNINDFINIYSLDVEYFKNNIFIIK